MIRKKCFLVFLFCIIAVVLLVNNLFLTNGSQQHQIEDGFVSDERVTQQRVDDTLLEELDENDLKLKMDRIESFNYLDDSDDHIIWFVHVSFIYLLRNYYFIIIIINNLIYYYDLYIDK